MLLLLLNEDIIIEAIHEHSPNSEAGPDWLLTSGCSAASNWQPGPHAVSTIVCSSWNPSCC